MEFFTLTHGQDCPLSNLFILYGELLGSPVRDDNKIQGLIVILGRKPLQNFAITIWYDNDLDGSQSSFSRTLKNEKKSCKQFPLCPLSFVDLSAF